MNNVNWRELPACAKLNGLICELSGEYKDYCYNATKALELITGSLRISLHNEHSPDWIAVIWDDSLDHGHQIEHYVGQADSAALAICRAWLDYQEHTKGHRRNP